MASKQRAGRSQTVAPYGTWHSPITTDLLVQKNISFGEVIVTNSADRPELAFIENRPNEGGRAALIQTRNRSVDAATDLTAGNFNVRSGVHEYGGGAVAVLADDSFLFTDYNPKSFNVFRTSLGKEAQVVSPENAAHRFGDFGPHPTDSNLALAILEDHTIDEPSKVVNNLICLDLTRSPAKVYTLLAGKQAGCDFDEAAAKPSDGSARDFYTFPRFSPNGKYVAWISWLHPSMPWWGTELWVARFERGQDGTPTLSGAQSIRAGAPDKVEALQQPVWGLPRDFQSSASELFFTSDATDFSNLYSVRVDQDVQSHRLNVTQPELVLPEPVKRDFGPPCWTLNNSSYVPLTPDLLVAVTTTGAKDSLALINLRKPRLIDLAGPFVTVSQLRKLTSTSFVFVGSRDDEPPALVSVDLRGLSANGYKIDQGNNITVIKRSSDVVFEGTISKDLLSSGEEIDFPTELPDGKPSTSHAIIFPPRNPRYSAPAGTSPPCIVTVHGGPTSSAHAGLNLQTQFWTSRGWLVCSVNYGGSTGYGREFMNRLMGQWGVVDIKDCIAAAEYLGSNASGGGKRYRELSLPEAVAVRKQLSDSRAQRSALSERQLDNGSTQITLRNTEKGYGWTDLVFGAGLAALAALAPPFGRHVAVGGTALWLWSKLRRVESQSLTVIPSIGLQISTKRALALPSFVGGKRHFTVESSRLIPRDRILDLYVGEGFRRWSIVDYLALVEKKDTSRGSDSKDARTQSRAAGGTLINLFSELSPRLSTVERIYRTIYPALFGEDGKGHRAAAPAVRRKTRTQPLADPNAIVISGGSSGGYTVLLSLCLSRVFAAGTSRYGICDLKLLAADSHKFESQYPFQLIGGTPSEVPEVYRERSPIYRAEGIRVPLLVQQGTEDKVVPPNQSEKIVEKVRERGGRVEYLLFKGEGHGFRSAENQKKSLQAEVDWYTDVLHLTPSK